MSKLRKYYPTRPQDPPKRSRIIFPPACADPCRLIILAREYYEEHSGRRISHAGGRTPAHCLRSARPAEAATNFERPFTPRTSLRSPRNFGNARFRRFANFDFLTPKIFFSKKKLFFFGFSLFSVDFRGVRLFLTSESSSS